MSSVLSESVMLKQSVGMFVYVSWMFAGACIFFFLLEICKIRSYLYV